MLKIKKKKKNTNFEDFEEIQDDSSSNTVRSFKIKRIEEEESLKERSKNYSKEETIHMFWKMCAGISQVKKNNNSITYTGLMEKK